MMYSEGEHDIRPTAPDQRDAHRQSGETVRESICHQEAMQADFKLALCDWVIDRVDYVVGDYREAKPMMI